MNKKCIFLHIVLLLLLNNVTLTMKSNKKKIKRPTSENVIIITISSMLEYFNFKPNNKESQADQLSNQTKNYLGQPITKNSYDKDWQIVYKTNEDAMKNSGEF